MIRPRRERRGRRLSQRPLFRRLRLPQQAQITRLPAVASLSALWVFQHRYALTQARKNLNYSFAQQSDE
jgi:hypothetical protein